MNTENNQVNESGQRHGFWFVDTTGQEIPFKGTYENGVK